MENVYTTSGNPKISGYLKKQYNPATKTADKDYITVTMNGKSIGKFQLSIKNEDGSYSNYVCETWNLYIIGKLQEWEDCLVSITNYKVKTREHNGKTYTDYEVINFDSVFQLKKKEQLPEAPSIDINNL